MNMGDFERCGSTYVEPRIEMLPSPLWFLLTLQFQEETD